jgi:hypothetical protein
MVVCVCVCSVQECGVLTVVTNRIVFVLGSNENYTRLGLPDNEDGGVTMLRKADNPLTAYRA